eukprot:TRINITY_DN33566_c0_g1_i1.p1 TRINITY_DN33566_c0_g1~~TRINITY_DN33566_c0_g1_i1.p1  ORF type:complete len:818 (-),score=147.92 TRINITY_DN33566_c0_g1_i1:100-2214(-)
MTFGEPSQASDGTEEVDGGDTGGSSRSRRSVSRSTVVGEVELELEFMEEPLARPTPIEGTFRRQAMMRHSAEMSQEEHLQMLHRLCEAGSLALPVVAEMPTELRSALAVVIVTSVIAWSRRAVEHEEDSLTVDDARLTNATSSICNVLRIKNDNVRLCEELLLAAENVVALASQEEALEPYFKVCEESELDPLIPLASVLRDLHNKRCGGAMLRMAILASADAVAVPPRGREFIELVEREMVRSGVIHVHEVPDLLREDSKSSTSYASEARDFNQGEVIGAESERAEQARNAQQMALNFLPCVDVERLVGSKVSAWEQGTPKELVENAHLEKVLPGTLALSTVAGFLGGLSATATAKLIHGIDQEVLCKPSYQRWLPIFKPLCHMMNASNLDEVLANWIATPWGFKVLFGLYFGLVGKDAYQRLCVRYLQIRELALEPLGPSYSPHAVICASGFIASQSDLFRPWAVDPAAPWTLGQVFAVRYDTNVLWTLGQLLKNTLLRARKQTFFMVQSVASLSNPVSMSQRVIDSLLQELDDELDLACQRAAQAGRVLALQLLSWAEQLTAGNEGYPLQPVSLVGCSAGAVLVHSCLQELHSQAKAGNVAAANLVTDVILIGAPLPTRNKQEWKSLRQLVSGRFVNGYFPLDTILLSHLGRRGVSKYIGCSCLWIPGVENILLNEFVTAHWQYTKQMPLILEHIRNTRSL